MRPCVHFRNRILSSTFPKLGMSSPSNVTKQTSSRDEAQPISMEADTGSNLEGSTREIELNTTDRSSRSVFVTGIPDMSNKPTSSTQEFQDLESKARAEESWDSEVKPEYLMMMTSQGSGSGDVCGETTSYGKGLNAWKEETAELDDSEYFCKSNENLEEQSVENFQSDRVHAEDTKEQDFDFATSKENNIMMAHWRMDEHFQNFKKCLMAEFLKAEIAREADRTKKLGQLKSRYEALIDGLRLEMGKMAMENDELRKINDQAVTRLKAELKERGNAKFMQKHRSAQFRAFSRWQSWRAAASKLRKSLMGIFKPYITETRFMDLQLLLRNQLPSVIDETMIPDSALEGGPSAVKWARRLKQSLPFQIEALISSTQSSCAGSSIQPCCKVNLFRFCEWAALTSSGMSTMRRASQVWRKRAREAAKKRYEGRLEIEKQQAVEEMEQQASAASVQLKTELDTANKRIAESKKAQGELETRLREAFMRGVCAINIEALTMMKAGKKNTEQLKPEEGTSVDLPA